MVDVAVVHNGIIGNYQQLREELTSGSHTFKSDTDTEIILHLIEEALRNGQDPESSVRTAVQRLEGSYALSVVIKGTDAIFAARNDSPLVFALADNATFLASDVPEFREFTDRVVYLDDGEFARLDAKG